jgi:hypothetical protein
LGCFSCEIEFCFSFERLHVSTTNQYGNQQGIAAAKFPVLVGDTGLVLTSRHAEAGN